MDWFYHARDCTNLFSLKVLFLCQCFSNIGILYVFIIVFAFFFLFREKKIKRVNEHLNENKTKSLIFKIIKQDIINIASIWIKSKYPHSTMAHRENICDSLALVISINFSTIDFVISKAIKVICIVIKMNEKIRNKYHHAN